MVRAAMLKPLQVTSRQRQRRLRLPWATSSPRQPPAHRLTPISHSRFFATTRRRVPVRLRLQIDKPSVMHARTPSARCATGHDFRNLAPRAQQYGCASLAAQSGLRSRSPLGAIVAIRESAACGCAKVGPRMETHPHIFSPFLGVIRAPAPLPLRYALGTRSHSDLLLAMRLRLARS